MNDNEKLKTYNELVSMSEEIKTLKKNFDSYKDAEKTYSKLAMEAQNRINELHVNFNNNIAKLFFGGVKIPYDVLFM